MKFFDAVKNFVGRKTQAYWPNRAARIVYVQSTLAGIRVTPDTALQSDCVWACVQILSKSIAQLPWRSMRETSPSSSVICRGALDDLLNIRPNPEMSAFTFREMMMGHVLTWGNAFAEIERDNAGRPIALWPIEPDRVWPKRWWDTNRLYYQVNNQTKGITDLDYMDMFHLHGPSYDGITGYQCIGYFAQTVGLAMAIQRFGASFFGNNGQLGGVISNPKTNLNADGREAMLASFNEKHRGPDQAFKWQYLDSGMTATPIGIEPDKGQFIQSQQQMVETICRLFGVPPHKVGHLLRCVPGDTRVFTELGPKLIRDVRVGERVWSAAPEGLRLCKVLNNWENGVDEILEISTTNRRFRCNPKHKVLVRRAVERELLPGEIGGKNVDGRKVRIDRWENTYVPAAWLREGDVLIALDRVPESQVETAPNFRVLTEDFMAFCGLLLGDGNVTKVAGRSVGVQIARGDSARYMDYYREVMVREFAGTRTRKKTINGVLVEAADAPVWLTEDVRQTKIRSVVVGEELEELGFCGTARTKRVPGWVFRLSERMRLAFIRGFFEADGTVNKFGRISGDSCNRDLLEDVRHLCMSCGVPVTNVQTVVVDPKISGGFGTEICVMYRFTCSDPGQNVRIGSHDPVDLERLQGGKEFGKKGRAYPNSGGLTFDAPGLSLSKIVSIVRQEAEAVFDIEVDCTHNFFADGVVVSNSTNNNIEYQGIEFVTDGILPWTVRLEQEAQYKLINSRTPQGYYTRIDVRSLQRGDLAARTTYYMNMFDRGVLSPNDILQSEGLNPLSKADGGDKHFVMPNMMLLKTAGDVLPGAAPGGGGGAAPDTGDEDPDDEPGGGSEVPGGPGPSDG